LEKWKSSSSPDRANIICPRLSFRISTRERLAAGDLYATKRITEVTGRTTLVIAARRPEAADFWYDACAMKRKSMNSRRALSSLPIENRSLEIEEIRLVSDLRIMHSKVDELYQLVNNLQRRHRKDDVHKYADQRVLTEDIDRVDEIYLWFVSLKENSRKAFAISKK
jgi:hypothetical protein